MAEIASGLQALYALNPEGVPGADVLQATMQVWASDLWNSERRFWNETCDAPCIRKAFVILRQTVTRWPTPAKFWEVLPNRETPTTPMLGPGWGREREREALAAMDRQFAELGLDRSGRPVA